MLQSTSGAVPIVMHCELLVEAGPEVTTTLVIEVKPLLVVIGWSRVIQSDKHRVMNCMSACSAITCGS